MRCPPDRGARPAAASRSRPARRDAASWSLPRQRRFSLPSRSDAPRLAATTPTRIWRRFGSALPNAGRVVHTRRWSMPKSRPANNPGTRRRGRMASALSRRLARGEARAPRQTALWGSPPWRSTRWWSLAAGWTLRWREMDSNPRSPAIGGDACRCDHDPGCLRERTFDSALVAT
jgi:hypothetical protein